MSFSLYLISLAALIILWAVAVYNRFIRFTKRVEEGWSDIDVQLKRRHDLIPNLVETVKGYAAHEKETLDRVIQARARTLSAQGAKEQGEAENQLAGALKSIFALAENYPDLKANQNFLELQRELSDTENKIQAARRFYNATVRDLNTGLLSFPANLIGDIFGFKEREFFELEDKAEAAPIKVAF